MNQKMVFIASLHRSGSTVLEFMLGGHPRCVGLGEVFSLIDSNSGIFDRIEELTCSCGDTAQACVFWRNTLVHLRDARHKDRRVRYRVLLECFKEHFGTECIPVDSSKRIHALEVLRDVPGLELKVIYLIRDVRGYTTSLKEFNPRPANRPLASTSFRHFLRWHLGNVRIKKYLRQANIPHFQIGYEELILYPMLSAQKMCDFFEIEYSQSMLSFEESKNHNIL